MKRIIEWLAIAAIGAMPLAQAQDFPTKPIRVIVPFPPGGPSDNLARPLLQKLGEQLGQPVVIDNRGGANGNIGADMVAKSPPDGYSLVISHASPHGFAPGIVKYLMVREAVG